MAAAGLPLVASAGSCGRSAARFDAAPLRQEMLMSGARAVLAAGVCAALLILDLRDLQGMIFGSEQMREWTVMARTRRFQFANPLGPLYDRIAAVKSLAGDGVPVEGRVVFSDRGEFPKGHPRLAVRLASLLAEFPPPDPEARQRQVAAYEAGWQKVRAAVTPSPLRRP